jgi:carbamoyl-phosphate synthase large subunit
MPKRTDISKILVLGAGPIIIGQACEFDYSGTQACRVLKEEGYSVILINSNPATIMTDPSTADHVFIEPITPECIEKIIKKERPDALLPTVGGQTALNTAMELHKQGILDRYGITMIGADPDAIDKAENRSRFNQAMAKIGLEVPRNVVVQSMEAGLKALESIGLPAIIRPSFTLGGSGSGIARTKEEFIEILKNGLALSPTTEVLIDESILGWKEYEMEVIRDIKDNAIIICSIENIDPMGVHTGDSITVAPALTLTDKEYQIMRDASIAVLREIGVETGGSNVQFAVNPKTGKLIVIEMNPRVSRSSALASKATGYPIAKVAARLAVGYTLDEIDNDITKVTPAAFEPTIDYVVTKIPRFTFEKFPGTTALLSSQMKSVGEAMSIGRCFAESLQKGLQSMETGLTGLNRPSIQGLSEDLPLKEAQKIIKKSLEEFSPDRILRIAHAIRLQVSLKDINEITHYDLWYLEQIKHLIESEEQLKQDGVPKDKLTFLRYKKEGFSDARIAELTEKSEQNVRDQRHRLGCRPVYKKVDTCAAEFESHSAYMYSCYEGNGFQDPECESNPSENRKVIILGGGPNRIGQGIEFDYACVHAAFSLAEEDIETIMVNCNPETVSTDYDTSDKLYFEPLTEEHVIELVQNEQKKGTLVGVIVQFGGQTPLKLSKVLQAYDIPIIGTSPDKIDLAEDRERFKALLHDLNLKQPINEICHHIDKLKQSINSVGYPVVIRPSNVLGGRAMDILFNDTDLAIYLKNNEQFILNGPILIDKFLNNAIEVDVDALSDGETVFVAGILEHIEEAGIHSGDSACSIPTYSLTDSQIQTIKKSTIQLAKALEIKGLMNVQYALQGDTLFVIEVNPRASRTVPFVAKSTGNSIAKIAAKLMIGQKLSTFKLHSPTPSHYSVKEVTFPFGRFDKVDSLLGPEMKSTGEAMGIDQSFGVAFFKAQEAVGNTPPLNGNILISVRDEDKPRIVTAATQFKALGFKLYATKNTAKFLEKNGIPSEIVNKREEGTENGATLTHQNKFQLIVNIPDKNDIKESYHLRRAAIMGRISYVTTVRAFDAMAESLNALNLVQNNYTVSSLNEWMPQNKVTPPEVGTTHSKKTTLFISPAVTPTKSSESVIIQPILEYIDSKKNGYNLELLPASKTENTQTTPQNFREFRLSQLKKTDAFITIHTSISESSAFELSYHIFKGTCGPIFFAIWDQALIKTTLLKDLEDLAQIEYHTFSSPEELFEPLDLFLQKIANISNPEESLLITPTCTPHLTV